MTNEKIDKLLRSNNLDDTVLGIILAYHNFGLKWIQDNFVHCKYPSREIWKSVSGSRYIKLPGTEGCILIGSGYIEYKPFRSREYYLEI